MVMPSAPRCASIGRCSPLSPAASSRWDLAVVRDTGTLRGRRASRRMGTTRRSSRTKEIEVTRDFVIWSFYGYFTLFLLVEFVFTKYSPGEKAKGNRDPLSFLFFGFVPFAGIFLWMRALNQGWIAAHPSWGLWALGWAIGLCGFAIRIAAKRALGRFFTVRVQLQEGH